MQDLKDIVVYLDNYETEIYASRIAYASALAAQSGGHLIVAFSPEDIAKIPGAGFTFGAGSKSMLESYNARRRDILASLRTTLESITTNDGATCELRVCEGEAGEALMLHARHASLAILGGGRRSEEQVSALTRSENVIFASGRPSILLPSAWPSERNVPRKIVVGWNASREAARAISDAMPYLMGADDVHVVVVSEPKVTRLLGKDPGADISRHLARYGVPLTLECMDGGKAGELLLSHAQDVNADMIVAGAYGQPKISEFAFGGATRTLLANCQIPTLLSR